MYYTTMRLVIVLYNHFIHKEEFPSLLIAFVELGTGVRKWGRMGPYIWASRVQTESVSIKILLAYERIINC